MSLRAVSLPSRFRTPLQLLLLLLLLFGARTFHLDKFANNEVDVLPSALQTVDPDWLPNDWYLNLEIGYRRLFNWVEGPLVEWMGFEEGAIAGRIIAYLFFALALLLLFRTLRLRFVLAAIALLPFLNTQSMIAGEWMVGGIETKTFAYIFVLLSISAWARQRWLLGFAAVGAALSFHVLVGLYAGFCGALAIAVLHGLRLSEWKPILRSSWPMLITGAWGLIAIVQQFGLDAGADAAAAWDIYINFRVPHHVLPAAWTAWHKFSIPLVCLVLSLLSVLRGRTREIRWFGAYLLGCILLVMIGLSIHIAGADHLLRFYWFRFPDTMIPFGTMMLAAFWLGEVIERKEPFKKRTDGTDRMREWKPAAIRTARYGIPIVLSGLALISILRISDEIGAWNETDGNWIDPQTGPMLEWIRQNTPDNAVLLNDPMIDDVYVTAERATFVSFKHSPQSAPDIIEWYRRLTLCNGGSPPERVNHDIPDSFSENFYDLDADAIRAIRNEYGITHYLGRPDNPLPFRSVHRTQYFVLYEVDS